MEMIKTNWMEQKSNERVLEKIGESRSLIISISKGKSNLLGILYITMILLITFLKEELWDEDQEEDLELIISVT